MDTSLTDGSFFKSLFCRGSYRPATPQPNSLSYRAVHLDIESAAIAQNDEFKAVLIARPHICQTSKLGQETQYLASKRIW